MVDPTGKYKKLYSTLQAHLEELDQENLVRIKHTVDYCGMHFQFSLNPQPAGKRYPLRGSVQALDRLSHTIQTTTKTGKKVYARSDLSIPFPKDGQTLRQVASEKLCETIVSLFVKYKSTLSHSIGDKQNPRQSSLAALLLQFGPGFQNRSSITTEASKRQLHDVDRLADALLDLPLSSITHKRLSDALKPDISDATKLRYLRSLDAFLCYVQIRSTLSESLIPCLHPMIEELSKRSKKHTISKQKRKQAANARHLPDRIEQELNREIEKNLLTDPRFLAVALIKGSHLDVKDLMQLHIGDLVRNEGNPKIVFVDLKREYAQSATQNYIFPLFPYEATMVNRYLDALAAKNPQRIEPDRFLLSDDADGTKPLSFRGFTSFVRLLLMHYQFGYAELLGKMDLSQKHGIELLKRTYQHRIEKYADVTPQIDKSEYTFLLHRSLEGQIQGDHYRSFTDVNARERLLGLVWRDQRCIPIPKGLRQVLIRRCGDHAEVSCRNKDIGQAQTFTLRFTASEDGVAIFRAPYGAVFQVEEIKKKEEKGEGNTKDEDMPRESSESKH